MYQIIKDALRMLKVNFMDILRIIKIGSRNFEVFDFASRKHNLLMVLSRSL